jgi:hypothetical protein
MFTNSYVKHFCETNGCKMKGKVFRCCTHPMIPVLKLRKVEILDAGIHIMSIETMFGGSRRLDSLPSLGETSTGDPDFGFVSDPIPSRTNATTTTFEDWEEWEERKERRNLRANCKEFLLRRAAKRGEVMG